VRLHRLLLSICLVLSAVGAAALTAASAQAAEPHYYVALGDSLARGYMPGPGTQHDTDQGYVDDVYAALHAKDPSLVLVKLGCSGETTDSMINGGVCTDRYPIGTSQLAAAEEFLNAHHGSVSYLTLDIGANDVDGCTPNGSVDVACLLTGVETIRTNLGTILDRITAASGRLPVSAGMSYYDPFLEYYLGSAQGKVVAIASVGLLAAINTVEIGLYQQHGFKVADVAGAFKTTNFLNTKNVPGYGTQPVNVATICELTYMCSVQNIHPNVQGYQLIADTFLKRIG
jgi:lysophospholipase L1-like esterase